MIPIHPAHTDDQSDARDHGACGQCANGEKLGFRFSYAYQPIVDVWSRQIFAHEALVRGPAGEPATTVLERVSDANRYRFDQACRVKAIRTAAELSMTSRLSINFLPNAIYRPEVCIRTTLEAARTYGFPVEQIMFETTEGEKVADGKWFAEVLREYQRIGFLTAIDDFGAGYAGLNLLADFQPDIIKLDMELVRNIHERRAAQSIVRAIVRICEELDIEVIAEGIEVPDECSYLRDVGIRYMQGYLFARPMFEQCARPSDIVWPTIESAIAARATAAHCADDPFAGVDVRDPVQATSVSWRVAV